MSLRHAQLVISTDFVRCVICVIMVQLKTAGGNNSAPFVHSETFLHYNVLFLPWQGMFRGPPLRNFNQNWKNSAKGGEQDGGCA